MAGDVMLPVPDDVAVVVLQSKQPLTTDPTALSASRVEVFADGPPAIAVRQDVVTAVHVEQVPRPRWLAVLEERARAQRIEVVTNDEYCLQQCVTLRFALGLRSRHPRDVTAYLDKVVMKRRLAEADIDVPRWSEIDNVPPAADAPRPPDTLTYPVVVKPRQEANSRGVRVIRDDHDWTRWCTDRVGEHGWQVEEFVDGQMYFVDGLVVDGRYEPVLVGRYLGGLLPETGVDVMGAVSVPTTDCRWEGAVSLARRVVAALGSEGRFVTHLEFFDTPGGLIVLEVCARAPGALVSDMAAVTAGSNLETAHLSLQAGLPFPGFRPTGMHAAWITVLARPRAEVRGMPDLRSKLTLHRPPSPTHAKPGSRYLALMALLSSPSHGILEEDIRRCQANIWFD